MMFMIEFDTIVPLPNHVSISTIAVKNKLQIQNKLEGTRTTEQEHTIDWAEWKCCTV